MPSLLPSQEDFHHCIVSRISQRKCQSQQSRFPELYFFIQILRKEKKLRHKKGPSPVLTSAKLLINKYFRPISSMKKNENGSLKIKNIVASGSVADAIDLEFISNNITNRSFTKRKYPGAVYHMQNLKSAALIFLNRAKSLFRGSAGLKIFPQHYTIF
jgi:hypothetical protein